MIYIDANIIITLIEGEPVTLSPKISRIGSLIGTPYVFLTSILSRLECRVKPLRNYDPVALGRYEDLFQQVEFQVAEITAAIIEKATEIRATHNFKTPDAIHYATAILGGATTFLTGDKQLAHATEVLVEVL